MHAQCHAEAAFRALLGTAKRRGLTRPERNTLMVSARNGRPTATALRLAEKAACLLTDDEIRKASAVLQQVQGAGPVGKDARPVTGWRLTLALLIGEQLPALPVLPGRQIKAAESPPLSEEELAGISCPVELSLVLGISRQAAHDLIAQRAAPDLPGG